MWFALVVGGWTVRVRLVSTYVAVCLLYLLRIEDEVIGPHGRRRRSRKLCLRDSLLIAAATERGLGHWFAKYPALFTHFSPT